MTHRIVFLGSPEFAVPSLRAISNDARFDIALVVSQPVRRAGRGRKMTQPPVAAFASEAGLPLFQPHTLKDEPAIQQLARVGPDLLVVVAYGEILGKQVLSLPPNGALNVHPSLLPKYRGASPIPAAILNGDRETGVSIMKLVRRLDSGPVLATRSIQIDPQATTGSLSEQLSQLAAQELPDTADAWLRGQIDARDQDHDRATYTREWSKADARIEWNMPAVRIERLVRAALPWPVAWSTVDGSRVQIRWSRLVDVSIPDAYAPGSIHQREGSILVGTGDGLLELVRIQPESKRATTAADWWRGVGARTLQFSVDTT